MLKPVQARRKLDQLCKLPLLAAIRIAELSDVSNLSHFIRRQQFLTAIDQSAQAGSEFCKLCEGLCQEHSSPAALARCHQDPDIMRMPP